LDRKLEIFKDYYNHSRTHALLGGNTPTEKSAVTESRNTLCYTITHAKSIAAVCSNSRLPLE